MTPIMDCLYVPKASAKKIKYGKVVNLKEKQRNEEKYNSL